MEGKDDPPFFRRRPCRQEERAAYLGSGMLFRGENGQIPLQFEVTPAHSGGIRCGNVDSRTG